MKIFSVIVCYNPDIINLSLLCQTLINNNSNVIIVDNTSISYINTNDCFSNCTFFRLGQNTGIAHAQNIGIKHAIESGAEAIALFDQDSKIENNFLSSLSDQLKVDEPKVVAPVFIDNVKGIEFPSYRLNKLGFPVKVYNEGRILPYDVDFVISSGSVATTTTFIKGGLMDEDFFIDYVDTEWCIRCRNKKIPIQIVPGTIMTHSIGEKHINLLILSGFIHSPVRCYYQIRNSFLLLRKKDIPLCMALKEILSVAVHKAILIMFVKHKFDYLNMYYLAVIHGICGVVGKKPS